MYKNNIYIYQSIYIYIYFDMYKYVCTYTPWGGAIHIYIYTYIHLAIWIGNCAPHFNNKYNTINLI